MASAVTEEYLEAIYNITMEGDPVIGARLAEKFGVSRPTVTETVKRLIAEGLAMQHEDKSLTLTPDGQRLTEDVLRRHRLAERMLFDLVGMDWIEAHEQAHTLEHGMTGDLATRISERLGHPHTCPHGNPIPGNTTSGIAFLREQGAFRLTDATSGQTVRVVLISEVVEDESATLRQVGEAGIHPRSQLVVQPSNVADECVYINGDERRTLPRALAAKIWVTADTEDARQPETQS